MTIEEKKSRIHFYPKKNGDYTPSCKNIHCEKDFFKPKRFNGISSNKKKNISQKKHTNASLTVSNNIFNSFSRKKASDIFQTLKILKSIEKTRQKKNENTVLPLKPNLSKFSPKKEKNTGKQILETLKENSNSENLMKNSSALNTINLIPDAYKNKYLIMNGYDEEEEQKKQIKTSIEKNSTKIFGIDRLVKGRIQNIFGKTILQSEIYLSKENGKIAEKTKISKTIKNLSNGENEKDKKFKNNLTFTDQKNKEQENEELNIDLYNYKVDEMKGDLIENNLEDKYFEILKRFSSPNILLKTNKKNILEDESPIFILKKENEMIFKRASNLILKSKEFDSDEIPEKTFEIKNFNSELSQNLKSQGYYVFDSEKKAKKTKFPLLRRSLKLPKTEYKSTLNSIDYRNTSYSSKYVLSLTELEEKKKFNNNIKFISEKCFEEHKNNKLLIKELKGKTKRIAYSLKRLTFNLGALYHY